MNPVDQQEKRREQFLERALPSNEDAERVILGSILIDNAVMALVIDRLKPEDFYSPLLRRIYEAMRTLYMGLSKIDPILISEELKKTGAIDMLGGMTAITNLTTGLPHFSNVDEYIKVVIDKSRARGLIRACNSIVSQALAEEEDFEDTIQFAESEIYGISREDLTHGFVEIGPEVEGSIERAHTRQETGDVVVGLHSGLIDLDQKLHGFKDGNLIVVAARPSVGKSALAFNVFGAENALRRGEVVACFSLEMSKDELVDRVLCSEARVNGTAYGAGHLTSEEWARIDEAKARIQGAALYIDDSPDQTIAGIRSKMRRLQSSLPTGKRISLMVLDYLQLMGDDNSRRSRENDVSQFSRGLKKIAKEFALPVVALSQLNRQSENRSNHRPNLADLRESGAIEQDADVVMFIFREDMYIVDETQYTNEAEIIVAKQRNGPCGVVLTRWDGPTMRFDSLSEVIEEGQF